MAEGSTGVFRRGHATICLPIEKAEYDGIVEDPKSFRQWLDHCFAEMPELFPQGFSEGYVMKDGRISVKQGESLRRIGLPKLSLTGVYIRLTQVYLSGGVPLALPAPAQVVCHWRLISPLSHITQIRATPFHPHPRIGAGLRGTPVAVTLVSAWP